MSMYQHCANVRANALTLARTGAHPPFEHLAAYRAVQHQWGLISQAMPATLAALGSRPAEVDAAEVAGGNFFLAARSLEAEMVHQYDAAWLADPQTHRAAIIAEQERVRSWYSLAFSGSATPVALDAELRTAAAALATAVQAVLDLGILPEPPRASGE